MYSRVPQGWFHAEVNDSFYYLSMIPTLVLEGRTRTRHSLWPDSFHLSTWVFPLASGRTLLPSGPAGSRGWALQGSPARDLPITLQDPPVPSPLSFHLLYLIVPTPPNRHTGWKVCPCCHEFLNTTLKAKDGGAVGFLLRWYPPSL